MSRLCPRAISERPSSQASDVRPCFSRSLLMRTWIFFSSDDAATFGFRSARGASGARRRASAPAQERRRITVRRRDSIGRWLLMSDRSWIPAFVPCSCENAGTGGNDEQKINVITPNLPWGSNQDLTARRVYSEIGRA